MKKTHPIMRDEHSTYRSMLNRSNQEDGLIYLMESLEFEDYARMQLSWMYDPETFSVRFEDLIEHPELFEKIVEYCGMDVPQERLHLALQNNTFEDMAGRNRGVEDQGSHFRKGISGDWSNYFSDRVKNCFKEKYGTVLVRTGYERNESW